jgi:hypothetical protein
MKKYIIIAILILFGLVWYLNNPIIRLNRLYQLNLSIFTKKIIWNEQWSGVGDGKVIGLLKINKDDFSKLSKMCKSKNNNLQYDSILLKYNHICLIKYQVENMDTTLLTLVENKDNKENKYLFYKLVIQ